MLGGSTPKSSNNPANGTSNSGQQVGDSENMKVDESMPPRSCKNTRGTTRSTRTTSKLPRSLAKIKIKNRIEISLLQTWVKKGSRCEVPLKMQLRA